MIVDRTHLQILDANQAWQDLNPLPEPNSGIPLKNHLKLDLDLTQVQNAQLCQGQVLNSDQVDTLLCHVVPLNQALLRIECHWPEQTSLTQEYEHLKSLNQRKSDLIANISHELRTPLTAILGWPEILLDAKDMPGLAIQAAEAIRKDGAFLRDLLEDLIDLSKIEAGHLQLHRSPEDLCEIAQDAVDMLADKARQKQISVQTQLPPDGLIAEIDALRIMQVFINYLSNAIKYTQNGGEILLRIEAHPEQAVISISDNGIGMSEAMRQKVFERFIRAEEVTMLDGAGIGLSLVRKLVDLHGGHYWVESESGKGSRFYFSLPLSATPTQPASAKPDAALPSKSNTLQELHLLVVAQQAEERHFLEQLLSPHVRQIQSQAQLPLASDLPAAAQALLLSTSLAEQQHLDWLQQVRQKNPHFPILALSSSAMKGDRQKLLDSGYSAVLLKPFLKQDLLQCMQEMLTERTDV